MNKAYRLIWNRAKERWVVAAETIKGNGGPRPVTVVGLVAAALLALSAGAADALPTGGQVAAGQATISTPSATQMNINQGTNQAIINWNSFGIGRGEAVNISQPSASSALLNRVLGNNPSQIFGQLNANGRVFLVNPGGVLFAPGSSVNVGALVASSLNIKDSDFLNGKYSFFKDGAAGSVVNQGNISGGFVALLGNSVENAGTIVTSKGSTGLAAGDEITLGFDPNGLMAIKVDKAAYQAQVTNSGVIEADGGTVVMTASAADALLATVVNNSGTVRASGMVERNGEIIIEGGSVTNSGTLDASGKSGDGGTVDIKAAQSISHTGSITVDAAQNSTSKGGTALLITDLANQDGVAEINGSISARGGDLGGDGGFVETSGSNVHIGNNTLVGTAAKMGLAGTWLIDPTNFTVSAGGAAQTSSGIGATTLQTNLGSGNVSIATSAAANGGDLGDINVNADLSWSANKLTLTAHNDINVNAVMTASGTASLDLLAATNKVNFGLTKGNFTGRLDWSSSGALRMNVGGVATAFTVINDTATLQAINTGDLAGKYALGSNFSLGSIANWTPIGNDTSAATKFSGVFDGLGHVLANLNITSGSNVGLFGYGLNATLRNVGLANVNISTSGSYVGGLIGYGRNWLGSGDIANSFVTGSVSGSANVGGLVGRNYLSIQNSFSTANITASGAFYVGGLVGYHVDSTTSISNSFATGSVTGAAASNIGGLVGEANGPITNSYATGAVSGYETAGGLVGKGRRLIDSSYSTSNVTTTSTGGTGGGGLVGNLTGAAGSITNSYATGKVTSPYTAGGLVGRVDGGASVTDSHATGNVVGGASGNTQAGLVGALQTGTITNSYATGDVTGSRVLGGLVGYGKGTISNSYALGNVTSSSTSGYIGGLVAFAYGLNLSNSYTVGNVFSGGYAIGGLVGYDGNSTIIANSYATGKVTGGGYQVGGLVGDLASGSITSSFSTSNVSGQADVGGLVGKNRAGSTILNSFAIGSATASTDPSSAGSLVGTNAGTLNTTYATGARNGGAAQLVGTDDSGTLTGTNTTTPTVSDTNKVWDGGGGADTKWTTAANWVGDVLPTIFQIADIGNNTVTVDKNALAWDVAVSGTSTLTFSGKVSSLGLSTGTDIALNTVNTASGGTVKFTMAGNPSQLTMNGTAYKVITSLGAENSVTAGTDLQGIKNSLTGNYVLGRDIDASATSGWAGGGGFTPIGKDTDTVTAGFQGTNFGGSFDGFGHVIRNLTISRSEDFQGLFGYVSGTVSNVGVVGASVSGASYSGILAGNIASSATSNVYATGSVSGTQYVGGLAGYADGIISNTFAKASVNGTGTMTGGLIGWFRNDTVNNSYATGNVTGGTNQTGGLVGWNDYGTITNSYATGTVTGASSTGGLVGATYGSVSGSFATGSVVSTSGYAGGLAGAGRNTGTIDTSFATGTVSGTMSVGGLVGATEVATTNSFATGNVSGTTQLGGLVGFGRFNTSTISNTFSTGSVTGNSTGNVGGLVGYTKANITNSFATGAVDGGSTGDNVGGLAGSIVPRAANAVLTVDNSFATGSVAGRSNVAGLVGFSGRTDGYGNITNSFATGNVMATGDKVGGLLGFQHNADYGAVTRSFATGNVSGVGSVGGLVGKSGEYGSIDLSYATGSVVATGASSGGLVGNNSASISRSFATGSVSGSDWAGGLVGQSYGAIENTWASGTVTGGQNVGGLVGQNYGTISKSLATGAVTGSGYAGSLVGDNSGTVTNSLYQSGVNAGLTGFGYGGADADNVVVGKSGGRLGDIATYIAQGWEQGTDIVDTTAMPTGLPKLGFTVAGATTPWAINSVAFSTTPIYLRLITGTSVYGDTPSFTYGFYTAAGGSTLATGYGTVTGAPTWSTPLTTTSAVGTYAETATVGGMTVSNDDYSVGAGSAINWSITQRPITVTAANQSRTYGDANPTTGSVTLTTGTLANSDVLSTATLNSTATSTTAAGQTAALTPSLQTFSTGTAGNYLITYTDGTLTVTPATLTVTATDSTKIYGETPTLTAFTSSGLKNSETIGSVTLASDGTAATAAVSGSPYAITASSATGGTYSSANYTITYNNGSLTVTPAALTVTATDATKIYGETPTLTAFTSSGLQNGETIGSVTLASDGTAATAAVSGSPYAITSSAAIGGTFASGNYTITYNNGSLTVTPAALTVTATDATKIYGETPTLTAFTSSGLKNSETIGSVTLASDGTGATAAVSGSPYAITPSSATGGNFSSGNYTITYNNGSLTVTPAALSVTATDATKIYGETPTLTAFSSSGLKNDETIGSVTLASDGIAATAAVSGSPYAITPSSATGGTFSSANYTITYNNGSLTVTPAESPSTPTEPTTPTLPTTEIPLEELPPTTPPPPPTVAPPAGPVVPPPLIDTGAGGGTPGAPFGTPGGTEAPAGGTTPPSGSAASSGAAPIVVEPTFVTPAAGAAGLSGGSSGQGSSATGVSSVSGGFVDARPMTVNIVEATAFICPIPQNTFSHTDSKATILLTVKMEDGSPLPSWMSFDPVRKVITGTPPQGVKGEYNVIVTANDQYGGEARTELQIKVGL